MPDDEKKDPPVLPSPDEVIDTLDTITSEAQALRKKITDAVGSSMRKDRLAATNDPLHNRKKKRRRKRKKAR